MKTPTDELQTAIQADLFRALEAIPPVERSIEGMAAEVIHVLRKYLPTEPDIQVHVEAHDDRTLDIEIATRPITYTISGTITLEDDEQ